MGNCVLQNPEVKIKVQRPKDKFLNKFMVLVHEETLQSYGNKQV